MAAATYHAGQFGKVKIPGTPGYELPAKKWNLAIKGNNKFIPNSKDGIYRIPGLVDAEGSVDMPYDSANDPTLSTGANIQAGNTLVLNLFVDATNFYALTAIVDEVGPGMEIEGEITFNVKFSMQSGAVTYPTA